MPTKSTMQIGSAAVKTLVGGALLTIWGGMWLWYLSSENVDGLWFFVAMGTLLTGIVFLLIGGGMTFFTAQKVEDDHETRLKEIEADDDDHDRTVESHPVPSAAPVGRSDNT